MAVIEIRDLVKKFGKVTALSGIDVTVESGEIHAFLGPNGAGKTTTLRLLLGLLRPTAGSIKIFNRDAFTDAVELHRKLAYVPGEVNLWDNLSGGEVIDLLSAFNGQKINPLRKKQLLELYDLDPTKLCRTYSKGNRQKVVLVAALALDVDLYILDEPTTSLDPLIENKFHQSLQALRAEGKTIFLSSHLLSEVELLADRVTIIRQGKIVKTSRMSELSAEAQGRTLHELFLAEYQQR